MRKYYFYAARDYLFFSRNLREFSSELFSSGKSGLGAGSLLWFCIRGCVGNGVFSGWRKIHLASKTGHFFFGNGSFSCGRYFSLRFGKSGAFGDKILNGFCRVLCFCEFQKFEIFKKIIENSIKFRLIKEKKSINKPIIFKTLG